MKSNLILLAIGIIFLFSCSNKTDDQKNKVANAPIMGTWKLISGMTIQNGDTTFTDYTKNQKGIKIINDTHFSFMSHDLVRGKDSSAVFVSGGGRYTLSGNKYTEYLEFCNYREWEDNKFDFTVAINNDTLIQSGIEKVKDIGVDRITIEKYVKLKELKKLN